MRSSIKYPIRFHLFGAMLFALVLTGCASATYQSPAPSRSEIAEVKAQVATTSPQSSSLTLDQANAIATPIYESIASDAARICRTIAAADSCERPRFDIEDSDYVNAYVEVAGDGRATITLTRGLVEYLADQEDELALIVGHQYGHIITAHVEPDNHGVSTAESLLTSALSVLSAAGAVAGAPGPADQIDPRRAAPPTVYSQAEIDAYLSNEALVDSAWDSFSRAQELEADYLGTYLASRNGYEPTGDVFIDFGALKQQDHFSSLQKLDRQLPFSFWDTHPYRPERTARVQQTLAEIEWLQGKGYIVPIPPRLIIDITDNPEAFHSLEELVIPPP